MYSKEAHLNHDHNAANEKIIGVHATEKTSKNHNKSVYIELYCADAYIWVVFGSFLRRVNSDSFFSGRTSNSTVVPVFSLSSSLTKILS